MQRVLVTAAASGIGAAIAQEFLKRGDQLAICDIDRKALEALDQHAGVLLFPADIGRAEEVNGVTAELLRRWGGVDVLVNNAGVAGPTAAIEDVELDAWQQTIAVNLTGAFLFIRALARGFKDQGSGCIINVSSTSTRHAIPQRSPYVASKAGLEGLTRSVARELGPHGVRCNAVLPGFVDNARSRRVIATLAHVRGIAPEVLEQDALRFISLHRKIQVQEIADLCAFLASPAAAGITGQLIAIDGNVEWEE